ncbi:hypothetical protein Tco_0696120 [Tanacetum coccineum]
MDITKAEQIALDDALVAPANRLKIGKCNLRLSSDLKSKEATLQVVYDVLKLTPFYKAFQASADVPEIYMQEFWATASVHNRSIRFKMNNKKHIVNLEYFREMLQICPRIRNQKFDEPPFEQEILTFLVSLGHSGEIRKITDVNVNKLHQPWRSFAAVINKCLSGKSSYDSLRLSQAQIIWGMYHKKNVDYAFLLWEDFTYQVENKNTKKCNLGLGIDKQTIRNSESYKEYYAIASGEVPPKTKASVHKKKADSDTTPKEKPPTDPKDKRVKQTGKMTGSGKQKQPTTGLNTLSDIALTETEQLKKAIKRSRIQTHNSQASGSSDGVDILSKVPDEQVYEKTGTNEGAGDKPEYGDDDDEDDDDANKDLDAHDDDDDDATESDDDGDNITHPKLSTFSTNDQEEQDDKEEQEDNDEDKEEISDQLEGGGVDMTEADTTEDTEDAHFISCTTDEGIDSILNPRTESTTLVNVPISVATETPATTTTIPPPLFPVTQSSQQMPVTTTTITYPSITPPLIPNFASLFSFNQRVTLLESDLFKLKQSNPFAESISSIPGIVNEYLGSKMKEAVDKIIKDQVKTQTSKIKSKVEKYVTESLGAEVLIRSTNQPQTSYGIASLLLELELKRILMDKMEENKPIDKSDVQKNLYNALVKAYNIDKDLLSSYGDVIIIPTTMDDKDKDEESSTGSNRRTKRRRSGKEAESSKEPTCKESRTTSSSKGASRSQPTDLNETTHLEFITGDDDVIPTREFMATPIDFSAFMINRLKIDHLTQELLTGPTYYLIKGTCKSVAELDYHLEEVFKATNEQLDWNNPKGMPYLHNLSKPLPLIPNARGRLVIPFDHFINNDLEYLKGGSSSRKYTTSITKTKATDYGDFKRLRHQDIEDMLLLLVQGKLTNLSLDDRYALNVALRMYTRRIVIQERVEDLQLAVESYQKKINLTRPDTTRPDLRKMTPYTGYPDVQGIIYQDELSRNRLMRTDELHKFSDGTLNHVRTTLNDIATGIQMDYLPKRRWSPQDKRRARVMISAIDRKLRDRRLMRSLEKFVGGRPYGGDLRLLERTI